MIGYNFYNEYTDDYLDDDIYTEAYDEGYNDALYDLYYERGISLVDPHKGEGLSSLRANWDAANAEQNNDPEEEPDDSDDEVSLSAAPTRRQISVKSKNKKGTKKNKKEYNPSRQKKRGGKRKNKPTPIPDEPREEPAAQNEPAPAPAPKKVKPTPIREPESVPATNNTPATEKDMQKRYDAFIDDFYRNHNKFLDYENKEMGASNLKTNEFLKKYLSPAKKKSFYKNFKNNPDNITKGDLARYIHYAAASYSGQIGKEEFKDNSTARKKYRDAYSTALTMNGGNYGGSGLNGKTPGEKYMKSTLSKEHKAKSRNNSIQGRDEIIRRQANQKKEAAAKYDAQINSLKNQLTQAKADQDKINRALTAAENKNSTLRGDSAVKDTRISRLESESKKNAQTIKNLEAEIKRREAARVRMNRGLALAGGLAAVGGAAAYAKHRSNKKKRAAAAAKKKSWFNW